MIRIFSLQGAVDVATLRAILLADLIGFLVSLLVYTTVAYAVALWKKRRIERANESMLDKARQDHDPNDIYCRHCPRCHACSRPNPKAHVCWPGLYCAACRRALHEDRGPA